ncbi:MAG TPA: FAD-dependent monooxygenase [Acidimicrobiia bacterium]|nr:FAD-dependent monooxygenase [Acidimicrobiia bacterium]
MSFDSDLVVVGAGPSGLTLAVQASMMGAEVRVLERRTEPRAWAPALAIHPRTMEILRTLGVSDAVVSRGLTRVDLQVHVRGSVVEGSLGDLRLPSTEYPFILFAPQPVVEAALRERLASMGVDVEWGSELVGFEQSEEEVLCRVVAGGKRTIRTRYLAGCDGAESTVRIGAGIPFRGRSYRESIVIADAGPITNLETGIAHAFLRDRGIMFFFPLPTGSWRLIGPGPSGDSPSEVRKLVDRHTNGAVGVRDLEWIRVITPQHRLARSYRSGRVFLAGDAAHVHSPAGAQGMNTGIQDAVNLGWKLGLALHGGPESLLETYEIERRRIARQVVALTGLAYALEVSDFAPLRWGRRWAAQPVAGLLLPHPLLLSIVARLVSGLDTRYGTGALDHDRVSRRRCGAGRRLPDAAIDDAGVSRLHHLIDARAFTLAVTGRVDRTGLERLSRRHPHALTVHNLSAAMVKRLGPVNWVLVRPDGYIATSSTSPDLGRAGRYLDRWIGESVSRSQVDVVGVEQQLRSSLTMSDDVSKDPKDPSAHVGDIRLA